jgi:hypothetical protein
MAQKLELDICVRCNTKIDKLEDFSIEHITPWRRSEEPRELFFNLDNIAFSHLSCNTAHSRNPSKGTRQPKEVLLKKKRDYYNNRIKEDPEFAEKEKTRKRNYMRPYMREYRQNNNE